MDQFREKLADRDARLARIAELASRQRTCGDAGQVHADAGEILRLAGADPYADKHNPR